MSDVATPTAPATAASVMPGAAPAESAPPKAGSSMSDAFGALEYQGKTLQEVEAEPPAKSRPMVPQKPAPAKSVAPAKAAPAKTATPEAKPGEPAKAPEVKPGEAAAPQKPSTGWQRFHEAEKEIKTLKSRLEEKEKASAIGDDHPEMVRMRNEIASRETRLNQVEEHLRYKDYEASREFQEQYHKPYLSTAETATQRAVQMKVTDDNGSVRNLTPQEFWSIVHIDDADAAINAAEKLFGEGSAKANFVIERRNEILQAHQRAEMAKADFKKTAKERAAKEQDEFNRLSLDRAAQFRKHMTDGMEKEPELFKPVEGDDEGNALLEKGYSLVDRVFKGGAPDKEGEAPMAAEQMIAAHADIRNKAAAFPRLAHKYAAMKTRMAEMEQELADYRASGPEAGQVAGDKGKGGDEESWETKLGRLAE